MAALLSYQGTKVWGVPPISFKQHGVHGLEIICLLAGQRHGKPK